MNIQDFEPSPRANALSYPGKRPKSSFLFCYDHIAEIKMDDNKSLEESLVGGVTLSNMLEQNKEPPIKDRYMVIGYGSNVNPAQLQSKFSGLKGKFPVIKATLTNYDIVYLAGLASYGAIPATIVRSPGTTVEVWVNLLSEEQLTIMDKSEGRGQRYQLAKLDGEVVLDNNEKFSPIYAYVSMKGIMGHNGTPIRLEGIKSNKSKFKEMNQYQIIKTLLKNMGLVMSLEKFTPTVKDNIKKYEDFIEKKMRIKGYLGYHEILSIPNNPMKISKMVRD